MRFGHSLLVGVALMAGVQASAASDCPPLLRHSIPALQTGARQNLCQYRGKVILVVNTANYCGYTRHYGRQVRSFESAVAP